MATLQKPVNTAATTASSLSMGQQTKKLSEQHKPHQKQHEQQHKHQPKQFMIPKTIASNGSSNNNINNNNNSSNINASNKSNNHILNNSSNNHMHSSNNVKVKKLQTNETMKSSADLNLNTTKSNNNNNNNNNFNKNNNNNNNIQNVNKHNYNNNSNNNNNSNSNSNNNSSISNNINKNNNKANNGNVNANSNSNSNSLSNTNNKNFNSNSNSNSNKSDSNKTANNCDLKSDKSLMVTNSLTTQATSPPTTTTKATTTAIATGLQLKSPTVEKQKIPTTATTQTATAIANSITKTTTTTASGAVNTVTSMTAATKAAIPAFINSHHSNGKSGGVDGRSTSSGSGVGAAVGNNDKSNGDTADGAIRKSQMKIGDINGVQNEIKIKKEVEACDEQQNKDKKTINTTSTTHTMTTTTTTTSTKTTIVKLPTDLTKAIATPTKSTGGPSNNEKLNLENDSNNTAESNDSFIFAKPNPVLLQSVNPHIICNLCYGYLIDATTIVECLHSFCHSCLIKHLRTEQYCPRCEMMINTAKPNIRPDTTLQAIVYKLVPGLYERELMRKRAFYKDRPEEAALATPEQRGDDTEHLIFSPSDYMSLSLEYADINENLRTSPEYSELLRPRYIKCPSMFTVAHMKKFVYGKFSIDPYRFNVDIMYKVKTIVLLDHYTLMDVAYIYTWKRDAPMRFYFRVKECLRPLQRPTKALQINHQTINTNPQEKKAKVGVTKNDGNINSNTLLPLNEIKVESDDDMHDIPVTKKRFEIVSPNANSDNKSGTDNLKITLINTSAKDSKEKLMNHNGLNSSTITTTATVSSKGNKDKKDVSTDAEQNTEVKDGRKVENIKLKIDLSRQNSFTIINMSDPERKEIVKPVNPNKEWKVKNKRDKDFSSKNSSKPNGNNGLTVPPLTIRAERINYVGENIAKSPNSNNSSSQVFKTPLPAMSLASNTNNKSEDDRKSQFLKSFSLAPIESVKSPEKPKAPSTNLNKSIFNKSPEKVDFGLSWKRKSKESIRTYAAKKPKLSSNSSVKYLDDFKIKLPGASGDKHNANKHTSDASMKSNTDSSSKDKPLMPPPTMPPPMRFSLTNASQKKSPKSMQNKQSQSPKPGIIPHPTMPGVQVAAPGNRTPIAKRYQPILPKSNPFADLPCEINKMLKNVGTEIKSIKTDDSSKPATKIYGPKTETLMGPPPSPKPKTKTHQNSASLKTNNNAKAQTQSNYLNYALFNATKTKGNEAPPGCRTPIYSPNSPIYSPSSPQYVPNYNIPTVPQYKYTPKPSSSNDSILQSLLGGNNAMANLFPAPPSKKPDALSNQQSKTDNSSPLNHVNSVDKKVDGLQGSMMSQNKRVYPFKRSPSPASSEDPPEKQLKVKSLLNSCNISIPSSLSITITREDGESSSGNKDHPKHKSPVNNYIEILKLPEQTPDQQKRLSPPVSAAQMSAAMNIPKPITNKPNSLPLTMTSTSSMNKNIAPAQTTQALQNSNTQKPPMPKPNNMSKLPLLNLSLTQTHGMTKMSTTLASSSQGLTTTTTTTTTHSNNTAANSKINAEKANNILPQLPAIKPIVQKPSHSPINGNSLGNKNTTTLVSMSQSSPTTTTSPINSGATKVASQQSAPPKSNSQKSTISPTANNNLQVNNKKTPSPEKRPNQMNGLTTTSPEGKSSTDGPTTKKFRHILPRQDPQQSVQEVVLPKVNTGTVIGTYSSPNGVSVKIHANNKKITPPKKSPGSGAQTQQLTSNSNAKHLTPSPPATMQKSPKQTTPKAVTPSPKSSPNDNLSLVPASITPNSNNKKTTTAITTPTPTLSPSSMNRFSVTSQKNSVTPPNTSANAAVLATNSSKAATTNPIQAMAAAAAAAAPIGTAANANMPGHLTANGTNALANSNAAADFGKILKENLLRAQVAQAAQAVQAAQAAQSNLLYTYAQMNPFHNTSPIYNYQQAYIMQQLSQLRCNNDFAEYMQKLRGDIEKPAVSPATSVASPTNSNHNNDSKNQKSTPVTGSKVANNTANGSGSSSSKPVMASGSSHTKPTAAAVLTTTTTISTSSATTTTTPTTASTETNLSSSTAAKTGSVGTNNKEKTK